MDVEIDVEMGVEMDVVDWPVEVGEEHIGSKMIKISTGPDEQ